MKAKVKPCKYEDARKHYLEGSISQKMIDIMLHEYLSVLYVGIFTIQIKYDNIDRHILREYLIIKE